MNKFPARAAASLCAIVCAASTAGASAAQPAATTPIEHLIVLVGENQSFDAVFATYAPPPGEHVWNLRSLGIVNADGSPGEQYARALQQRGVPQQRYSLQPPRAGPYDYLPQPTLIGVPNLQFRLVGNGPDPRFPADLPPGPFALSRYVDWPRSAQTGFSAAVANLGASTGDPVHRFFQMWQQTGGSNERLDLYTWVAVTTGMGADTPGVTSARTGQGGELMGFVNIEAGDAPVLRALASRYAMSDNYHQAVMGGTGANFFALATADLPFYVRAERAAVPPPNQIEDPDPAPGSANFYRRDGYQGGSYVNCSEPQQSGVAAILALLQMHGVASRCEAEHYYLVNNYVPGYDLDGHLQPLGPHNYVYPPQTVRTIAEALSDRGVSWGWYTGGRDDADLQQELQVGRLSLAAARRLQYNVVGDPLVGSEFIMSRPELRAHLKGLASFAAELQAGTLPAVCFVVPKSLDSGHPGSSVLSSYEAFVGEIVAKVQAQPQIWAHAAIIATLDEGGGHFDSGYIQSLDFFGDGTRIPLLVISPYTRAGHIDHVYNDHISILKFIEHNWGLAPLTARSRDNLPDPVTTPQDPYRPVNSPAIGDLMTLFDF